MLLLFKIKRLKGTANKYLKKYSQMYTSGLVRCAGVPVMVNLWALYLIHFSCHKFSECKITPEVSVRNTQSNKWEKLPLSLCLLSLIFHKLFSDVRVCFFPHWFCFICGMNDDVLILKNGKITLQLTLHKLLTDFPRFPWKVSKAD